MSTSPSCGGD